MPPKKSPQKELTIEEARKLFFENPDRNPYTGAKIQYKKGGYNKLVGTLGDPELQSKKTKKSKVESEDSEPKTKKTKKSKPESADESEPRTKKTKKSKVEPDDEPETKKTKKSKQVEEELETKKTKKSQPEPEDSEPKTKKTKKPAPESTKKTKEPEPDEESEPKTKKTKKSKPEPEESEPKTKKTKKSAPEKKKYLFDSEEAANEAKSESGDYLTMNIDELKDKKLDATFWQQRFAYHQLPLLKEHTKTKDWIDDYKKVEKAKVEALKLVKVAIVTGSKDYCLINFNVDDADLFNSLTTEGGVTLKCEFNANGKLGHYTDPNYEWKILKQTEDEETAEDEVILFSKVLEIVITAIYHNIKMYNTNHTLSRSEAMEEDQHDVIAAYTMADYIQLWG